MEREIFIKCLNKVTFCASLDLKSIQIPQLKYLRLGLHDCHMILVNQYNYIHLQMHVHALNKNTHAHRGVSVKICVDLSFTQVCAFGDLCNYTA